MAELPGDRAGHLRARRLAAPLAALLLAPAAAAQGPLDLAGTWHVLVHYRDARSNNPDAERWLDRVWVFEPAGGGLRWTEYPIVVFDDGRGRFERRPTGQHARVLQFWEPSPEQRANIRRGLQVNDRGSRTKTLRGSAEEGWTSASRARPTSASVVTYTDHWSVEGLGGLPVFTRREELSSGRSDSLEGLTRFSTERVSASGNRLTGHYERDGRHGGVFTMRRAGDTRELEGSGKTQGQRVMEAFFGDWAEAIAAGPDAFEAEIQKRLVDADLTEEERARLAQQIRGSLGTRVERLADDAAGLEAELDRVTDEIQRQIEQGRSMREIAEMLRDGEIGR